MFGVTTTWGATLKGRSIGKVKKCCSGRGLHSRKWESVLFWAHANKQPGKPLDTVRPRLGAALQSQQSRISSRQPGPSETNNPLQQLQKTRDCEMGGWVSECPRTCAHGQHGYSTVLRRTFVVYFDMVSFCTAGWPWTCKNPPDLILYCRHLPASAFCGDLQGEPHQA